MLGTGAYLGIDWACQGFLGTVDNTLDTYSFQDIEVKHPYGITDDYLLELEEKGDLYTAEGEYSCYQYFKHNNSLIQTKVTSLTEKLNVITDYEGELPKNNKECAIERFYANSKGIKIGDVIEFVHDDDGSAYQLHAIINNDLDKLKEEAVISEDGMARLTNDKFTVTALVESPEHIGKYEVQQGFSDDGTPVGVVMYVTKDTFDLDVVPGYTKALLRTESLRQFGSTSNDYLKECDSLIEEIKASSYFEERNAQVVENQEKIRAQILQEITKGEQDIIDGKAKLKEGEAEIENGRVQLADAKKELEEGRIELDNSWVEYNEKLAEFNESKESITKIQNAYDISYEFINKYYVIHDLMENFDDDVDGIKSAYDVVALSVGVSLPNTYYVVSKLDEFFTLYDTDPEFRNEAGEFVGKYNEFVVNAKEDVNFPSREAVNNELDLAISLETDEMKKLALINLKDRMNGFYNDMEDIETMPQDLIDLLNLMEELDLLELFGSSISQEVENELSSRGIPTLKDVLTNIDSIVESGYETYEDIKPYVTLIYNYLSTFIEEIDEVMEEVIKPILDGFWDILEESQLALEAALSELNAGEERIANGWIEYNNGFALLAEKEVELENGRKQISDAEIELAKGNALYEKYIEATKDIKAYDAIVLSRQSNCSVLTSRMVAELINKLKLTMGLLFVIVGIFVSYSSMARLVYDKTREIGTKKALGLRQREITSSFIMYSLFATVLGSVLGIFFSCYMIEPVINYVIADSYNLSTLDAFFDIKEFLIFSAFEILVTVLASFIASRSILKRKAVKLLNASNEITGKVRFYEKSGIWKSLPLLTKTIVNNIFNDKRRVFGTIVGITGCATLLVCAMSFNNNIEASLERQVNELSNYDTFISLQQNGTAEDEINKKLDEFKVDYIGACNKPCLVKTSKGEYVRGAIYTAKDEKIYDYCHLQFGDEELRPTNGAIISQNFSEEEGLTVGDEITFTDFQGKDHRIKIEGICENYLLSVDIYIDEEVYEGIFNEDAETNTIYLRRNDLAIEEISRSLSEVDGFVSATDFNAHVEEGNRAITSIAFIVYAIFLAISTVLAFLVILNLLVVFVDEKKKETIVLMINGYGKKYAKKYVYTDTIFLGIISIIIGSVLGSFVGVATTNTLKTASSIYMTALFPKTFILASAITVVLCVINVLIAIRKIDKYRLTDINSNSI